MRTGSLPTWAAAILSVSIASSAVAQVDRTGKGTTTIGGDAARNVQRASCVLQLESTGDVNRFGNSRTADMQTLNALLTSTALIDPAAQKAISLGPEEWPRVAQVEVTPAGTNAVRLGVTVTRNADVKLPDAAAQAFLDELAARAKVAVEQLSTRQEQAASERLAALEKDRGAAQDRLQLVQAKLRTARAAYEAAENIGSRFVGGSATNERQTLETTLAAQRVRLKIIQEELAKNAANAASRPAASPWQDLIAAREKMRDAVHARHATGQSSELDVLEAEAKVAEAKVSAATAARIAGGFDPADRWENEVLSLRIGIAEAEAKLAVIAERTPKAAPATQPVSSDDLGRLQQDEKLARQSLSDLTSQIDQAKRDRRSNAGGVKLNVLDGKH